MCRSYLKQIGQLVKLCGIRDMQLSIGVHLRGLCRPMFMNTFTEKPGQGEFGRIQTSIFQHLK